MKFIDWLLAYLRSIHRWFLARFWHVYVLEYVAEEPPILALHTVYAVGENGHLWHVTLLCPCGCGSPITLNLLPDDSPRWHLSVQGKVPTLTPSVCRKVGCKSHFFLRNGRVDWCGR